MATNDKPIDFFGLFLHTYILVLEMLTTKGAAILLGLILKVTYGQEALMCTFKWDEPPHSEDDGDHSGLRTDHAGPPVQFDEVVTFTCPGPVKMYEKGGGWYRTATATCLRNNDNPIYEYKDGAGGNLGNWPWCKCRHDLSKSKCPAANYSSTYSSEENDPKTRIWFPLPKDVEDWEITVTMDTDVRALRVKTDDAKLFVKDDRVLVLSRPNGTEFNPEMVEIALEYNFGDNANQRADKPQWLHPCIEDIDCTAAGYGEETDSGNIWLIVGIVTASIIGLMIIGFLVCYCVKNSGGGIKPM